MDSVTPDSGYTGLVGHPPGRVRVREPHPRGWATPPRIGWEAFASPNHGYKARGLERELDVSSLGYSDAMTHLLVSRERICPHNDRVDWFALPIHHMPWMGERGASYPIGGDPRSPALLVLYLPCVTRAMGCDGPRWRAMNRGVSEQVCARWHDVGGHFDAGAHEVL